MSDLNTFIGVSRILTGVDALDERVAALHWQRLQPPAPAAAAIAALLTRVAALKAAAADAADLERRIQSDVLGDDTLRDAALTLIVLWYTAELRGSNDPGSPDAWFEGLFWRAARAHPPALSGGYFGHWAYPPDN
jgi:hypothetical protein